MWLTSANRHKHEPRIRWTLSVTAQWLPMGARSVPLLLNFPNTRGQLRAHCGQTHSQKEEEEGNELPFYHCPVVPFKITNLIHSFLPKEGEREGQGRGNEMQGVLYLAASPGSIPARGTFDNISAGSAVRSLLRLICEEISYWKLWL